MSHWKRLVCVLPALLINVSFAAQPPPKPTPPKPAAPPPQQSASQTIRARVIELTDSKGNIRASMGASDDGPVVFRLFNKEGKTAISIDSDGGITVMNAEGKPKVTVGLVDKDNGIGVYDSKGNLRADITTGPDEPIVTLRDGDGKVRGLFYLDNNEPYVAMTDGKADGARVALGVRGPSPILGIWDVNSKLRTQYGLNNDGSPKLVLDNSDGDACLKLLATDDLPSIEVVNPKNNIGGMLGFVADEDLALLFTNADSKVLAAMAASKENGPYISVGHASGNPAATMGISDSGTPYFRTADTDNNTLWRSP